MKKPNTKFTDEHLPKLPDWRENLPKFGVPPTTVTLGPPSSMLKKDESLLDAYFKGNITTIELDMQRRPDHYTEDQKLLVEKLKKKEPLPPGVGSREINDLVLRFVETSKQKEQRQQVVQRVQKRIEDRDPTLERKNKEDAERPPSFEDQVDKESAFIKII